MDARLLVHTLSGEPRFAVNAHAARSLVRGQWAMAGWLTMNMDEIWLAIGAVAGAATALGTVAMAIAVVITAVIASKTLGAARADSAARTRPSLVAEFRRDQLTPGVILLVLRNMGASVAFDVRVTFEPSAPDDLNSLRDESNFKWLYLRYAEDVPSWAPGWTLSNIARSPSERMDPLVVRIRYRGHDGTKYDETFHLQPDHITKDTAARPSVPTDPKALEQQKVRALQAIAKGLQS